MPVDAPPPPAAAPSPPPPAAADAPPPSSLDPNHISAPAPGSDAPPSPAGDPWTKAWLKGDGTFDHTALDKAPDEFKKGSKTLGLYKSIEELARANLHAEGMLGKKGIVDPLPANASVAEKASRAELLRKAVGAPDKPEGYGIKRPDNFPESAWNNEYATEVAKLFHEEAISPQAAQRLLALEVKYAGAAGEAQKQAETAWFADQDKLIRDSLGKEGVEFAKGKDLAERAGRRFGVDPENPVMKNASVFMLLTRIGRAMGEDKLVTGDLKDVATLGRMTPEAALTERTAIMSASSGHPDSKAYRDKNDPRHDAVFEHVQQLGLLAFKDRPRRTR